MPSADAIYVEVPMGVPLEAVWERTQDPALHERWDLRFSDIEYLPGEEGEPQRFTYRTRIGGIAVEGRGESVATVDADGGERTSALQFWSDDPKALIVRGRGYWRYVPTDDGHRFLTEYNYDVRYGRFGHVVDRLLFRPLLGWATAWSFDALRLWLEADVPPEVSRRNALVHGVARAALAFVWLFYGLVPKLLLLHPDERALAAGVFPPELAATVVLAVGLAEVGLGLALLLRWRSRWPLVASAVLPAALASAAAVSVPDVFLGPFSPVPLVAAMAGLAVVGYLAGRVIPTARHCLRQRPEP